MTVSASGRLRAYLGLGGAGLLAGLLFDRPEPVVLAAPFLLALAVGLALARRPQIEVEVQVDRERAVEGDEVEVRVEVRAIRAVADVAVRLAPGPVFAAERAGPRGPGALRAGRTGTYRWTLRCRRWGGRRPGRVSVRARDPLGFLTYRFADVPLPRLRVYPRPESIRRLLRPADTQAFAGNEVSRLRGDGIEFADVRAFAPGDRVRRINWRVSARRGELHVNEMRPERNADVVIFLDTFSEVRDEGGTTLDQAVRAAGALAQTYLRRRDRVGLIGFGGTLRWLRPEMGERQLYRVADALIDTEVVLSYAWKGLEVIPRQTLPPGSLVVALTPLLDDRAVNALLDLRGRGHDLSVIEVSPVEFVTPGRREPERLAFRLWELERETLRARFLTMGVPVVTWPRGEPLQAALAAAAEYRRGVRMVRV